MIKPKALRPGARVAIVSPASAPKEDLVRLGMARMQAGLGYQPVLFPSALSSGPLYYAGPAATRLQDLHAAFADPTIDAVCCTRGGWGTAELLDKIDYDLIRANPKPFIGFSDHTSLHTVFAQRCGLATFYAPMVSPDFARGNTVEDGVHLSSWRAALEHTASWKLGFGQGLTMLRPGSAQGTLFGGCLSILAESLGTPYAIEPPEGDSILFLEEIGTKAYQWDRMLLHLRYSGLLDRVRGFVFGDMAQCAATEAEAGRIQDAILHRLSDFNGPIAIGLQCGHVNTPNVTLPLNTRAGLECDSTSVLHLLESSVA